MDLWDVLGPFIIAFLVGIIMLWLLRANLRHRDVWSAATLGMIRPNTLQYLILGVMGLILTGAFIYFARVSLLTFLYEQLWLAIPGTLAFGAMTWMSVSMALSPAYHVTWTHDTLSGPASHWFPPFGPGRTTLGYDQLTTFGTDWTDSFFVCGPDGRKIRWSYLYKGFGALHEQLAIQRPDLFEDYGDDDWNEPGTPPL